MESTIPCTEEMHAAQRQLSAGAWERVDEGSGPEGRHSHVAVNVGGTRMLIHGGVNVDGIVLVPRSPLHRPALRLPASRCCFVGGLGTARGTRQQKWEGAGEVVYEDVVGEQ